MIASVTLINGVVLCFQKNSKFLRYLNATRNEIARFDHYAYAATPKFRYNTDDLDYFAEHHTYDELKEEQRRLRWLHILEHSMEDSVRNLRNKIAGKFTYSEFSELIARAYSLVSKEIHTLIYDVTFGGEYCPKITADKRVNSCINVIMEEVELDVGEMVPRAKKPKLDPGTSRLYNIHFLFPLLYFLITFFYS